jgi:hypothetical protein
MLILYTATLLNFINSNRFLKMKYLAFSAYMIMHIC